MFMVARDTVCGNLITIWIVIAHKRMRTVTNYFLVNLAFADLSISAFTVMFNFVYMLNSHWPFGLIYCKYSFFLSVVTITASVLTFLAIALDRYVAIVHPLRPRMSARTAWSVIAGIWTLAACVSMPRMIFADVLEHRYDDGSSRTVCFVLWPDGVSNKWDFGYTIFVIIVNYVIPMVVLGVAYTRIGMKLWGSKVIGENSLGQGDNVRSKKRVVKMMITVVLLFAVCWMPQHLYFIITSVNINITLTRQAQYIYLAIYWLAMSNSMYNPFIYCWMNSRFRQGFKSVFKWIPCAARSERQANNNCSRGSAGKSSGRERTSTVIETFRCERLKLTTSLDGSDDKNNIQLQSANPTRRHQHQKYYYRSQRVQQQLAESPARSRKTKFLYTNTEF
ncbi:tachykinin-like peptides receptor 99D [Tubulanus polymorphus]|uniref:tachykinin-like peptides receptor 99D n=1 Tax=Tubulanus polymorphus TaxID=672921 RepID=UPI003DA53E82